MERTRNERDKRSGITNDTDNQEGAASSCVPWKHSPPPTSYPGQPRSSFAAAAIAMAQEQETHLQINPIQDAAMDVDKNKGLGTHIGTSSSAPPEGAMSESLPQTNPIQDAAMDVDKNQRLGTCIGTPSGAPPEGDMSKSLLGLPLQVGKVCLPGQQIGDGVEIVMSNDNHESHAHEIMTQHPSMVSPLSVAPPVDV
jgi:hypothetical protein